MSDVEKVLKKHNGLTNDEIEQSKKLHGINKITEKRKKSFIRQYLESFGDPTIKILLIVLGLNILFFIKNFNWYESIGIAVSIILATLVSTVSEYGSQVAFEKLMEDAGQIKCRVWRDSSLQEISVYDVVVGDVIKLQSGDKIPADGVLIAGEIDVDQSALNGESSEAHKKPTDDVNQKLRDNTDFLNANILFSGTVVCDGCGIMLVQAVGDSTFYGELAKELQEDKQDSPLKRRLADLARTISRYGYIGAILVFTASLFNSVLFDSGFILSNIIAHISKPYVILADVLRALTFAITVVVVAVPEGLPLMITVVLSSNMKKMIHDNVLVRKLVGIETAGSLNILFTDKTGTLTKGQLKVSKFITGDNSMFGSAEEICGNTGFWDVFCISAMCNNGSQLGYHNGQKTAIGGNSTDRALLNYVAGHHADCENINTVWSIPFTSTNKYAVTKIDGNLKLNLIKGATEKILPYCTQYYDMKGNKQDMGRMSEITSQIKLLSLNGIRFLAIATSNQDIKDGQVFPDLTLVCIVGIEDGVRENARDSIREVTNAGVQVVMITGDGRDTATAIAEQIGLTDKNNKNQIITSDELNKLSDESVIKILPELRVVARAMPSDKSRLVRLSQSMGMVAGMTGDGVNDAPALQRADVGFAMGSGSEIAKEASDIVILDDNFLSIGKAILYGRTIFKSIRKFIIFQLSINVCAVGISIIGQFIGIDAPITVVQMLWVNMVMDTLAGLAFAGEAPLPEYMEEAPKKRDEKIINKYMANQIMVTGIYTTVMSVLFLKLDMIKNIFVYSADDRYLMTGFFAFFMFCAIFNSLNVRTHRLYLFAHILKNKAFVIIMGLVSAIQFVLLYRGGDVFRAYGLNLKEIFCVLTLAVTVIPVDLMRKSYLRLNAEKGEIDKFL